MGNMNNFLAKAVHTPVVSQERIDAHETLVYNMGDGFCWLRGKGGKQRDWQGNFPTAVGAEEACTKAGFSPEAITYLYKKI